ncbi:hypothetical protein [Helicobacter pylori]|nr:hypothetical protein [Helicobacter pylori]
MVVGHGVVGNDDGMKALYLKRPNPINAILIILSSPTDKNGAY